MLIYSMRAETRRQNIAMTSDSNFLQLCICVQMTKSTESIGFGVTSKLRKQANLQMWDLQIMRVVCIKTESPSTHPGGSIKSKLKSGGLQGKC